MKSIASAPRGLQWIVLLATLAVGISVSRSAAFAQRGPRGGFFPRSLDSLLAIPEVQAELKVGKQQKELLDALLLDVRTQRRGVFRSRPKGPEDIRQRFLELGRQSEEFVGMILKEPQMDRLSQIRLQREGAMALRRDEVVKRLKLTKEQRTKLEKLRSDFVSARRSREEYRKLEADMLALLTDTQKAEWNKLRGKQFKFPDRFRRGRRPR